MISAPIAAETNPLAKSLYAKIVLGLLGLVLITTTARLSGYVLRGEANTAPIDFHAFYVAARLVWQGDIEQAYHVDYMARFFADYTGHEAIIPWSYPAQYNLVVAPFTFVSPGMAYVAFMVITLVAYLATLRFLAERNLTTIVFLIFPALVVTIASGQNGFLTGTLIGLACIGLRHGGGYAGVPLGLMVIKPHLAAGIGLYTLLTYRWRVALVAALIVSATSVLALALLGMKVWMAFLGGLRETGIYLEAGLYPLYRMISPYAAIRSLGASALVALAGHVIAAVSSVVIILLSVRLKMSATQQLGIAIIGSLLLSPYAYDYDLPIYGIGLAVLLPDLMRLATEREKAAIFGLSFFTSALGLVNYGALAFAEAREGEIRACSFAGLSLYVLLLLTWRILHRDAPITRLSSGG